MLALILTDARAEPAELQAILRSDRRANLEPADGRWRHEHERHRLPACIRRCRSQRRSGGLRAGACEAVARSLARQQAADGEGATTLITCQVSGAASDAEARAVARAVVASSLVKTAVHGRDPNWGRIAAAAGNASVRSARPVGIEESRLSIGIAGVPVFGGRPLDFDRDAVAARMDAPELLIRVDLGARRRHRRGLRLRPDREIRRRELGLQHVSDRDELVVVKLGGTTLAEEHATLAGVAELAGTYRMVLVHGGGKRLTDWLQRLGLESRFDEGRRVTDDAALEVALAVLGGLVNGELVAELLRLGAPAVGLTGVDGGLLISERIARIGPRRSRRRRPAQRPVRAAGGRSAAGRRAAGARRGGRDRATSMPTRPPPAWPARSVRASSC